MRKFPKETVIQKGTEVFIEALRQQNAMAFFHPSVEPNDGAQALASAYMKFIDAITEGMALKPGE